MRSFGSLAWRQVRARRLRALLTTAGIVLGVGMIFGVLLLSATILRTFEDLFDSIYGGTDLVVSGKGSTGSVPVSTLAKVKRVEGVEEASANIFTPFKLLDRRGRARRGQASEVNVVGIDPKAPDLSDSRRVSGRRVRRGAEIRLSDSWARSHGIEVGDRIRLATPDGAKRARVVGTFRFTTGLTFGGQGFGSMPLDLARSWMDKPDVYDEVDVVVAGSGEGALEEVRSRLQRRLGRGVVVETPDAKGDEIQGQLLALNVVLYFFAGMALFVGGFLILNSFNMTVLQRLREIGMLRTLGATRAMVRRSVLREAFLLGVVGTALGLGLGVGLARLLIFLMSQIGFPVGGLAFTTVALVAAVVVGLLVTLIAALYPAWRAGRISPIRAILGAGEARRPPRARRIPLGGALAGLGLVGVYLLARSDDVPAPIAAAGIAGVVALLVGIVLVFPFFVAPLVRGLSWPLRRAFPIEGRLAADSTRSNPTRTAFTSAALMVGLALVVAFGSLGTSFLHSISDQFDRTFARDFTVQPEGFNPAAGPQQTISKRLRRRIRRLPEAAVVARERFFYATDLPGGGRKDNDGLILGFDPRDYEKVDATETVGVSREGLFRRMERGQISVGEAYADEAELKVGDAITLRGPSGRRRTRVGGIVKSVVFGGETVGMSIKTMRAVYGTTADSEYAVKAVSDSARPALRRKIERIVERDHPNLVVLSNDELKSEIEDRIQQQFGFFNAILAAAVIISLFGIVNTLSMSVIERTREIGVLRALGSSRWQVRRMIADESLVIALIGALTGILVGLGLGWVFVRGIAAGVPGVTYQAPVGTIAAVAIAGLVLGLLAAILPARRAARLDVIEALSYE